MKTCSKCKQTKPLTCFCKDKRRPSGLNPQCKLCVKEWRVNNAEYLKAYFRQYNRENKAKRDASAAADYVRKREQKIEAARVYRKNNPNKIRVINEEYYNANAERLKEKQREWNKQNPLVKKVHRQNRRARERNAGGTHTATDIRYLLRIQKDKCAHPWCRKSLLRGYHIDHIMPLARGGRNDRQNLQLLCETCNQKKKSKHPIDFAQQNGMLL
jgi:5-methylcytosine-specific restriction endonuclease McrA